MREKLMVRDYPTPISPYYVHQEPNENFNLYDGNAILRFSSRSLKGNIVIKFEWLPKPRVTIEGETDSRIDLAKNDKVIIDIPEIDNNPEFWLTYIQNSLIDDKKTLFSGQISDTIWVGDNKKKFREIIFHLPNFHRYIGRAIRYEKEGKGYNIHSGRLRLEGNKWNVILDQKYDYKEMRRRLKKTGGFFLGHTGKLTRVDKDTISVEESYSVLDLLYNFFSFCKGMWVGPVLPIEKRDEGITTVWGSPTLSPDRFIRSWFPKLKIDGISNLFVEFEKKWIDNFWKDNLSKVIYWYIEANSETDKIDGPIIYSQTALEHLSWVWIVEEKQYLTTREFKAKCTSDRINLLLKDLGIPRGLPINNEVFTSIVWKIRNNSPCDNGPELITSVRNMIVHPRKAKRERLDKLTPRERFEVKELSLLYIELVVLSILNYNNGLWHRLEHKDIQSMEEVFDLMENNYKVLS